MPPGLTIPTTFIAVDKFSAPIFAMRGALGTFVNKAQVGLAVVERGFRRLMSPLAGFQNMLRGLGVYVGFFSILLLMGKAVGVMADFEQAQVNISAVTGKAVEKNKALADQARMLALRYGEAAKSVLELDLALIKQGFKEKEVLNMAPAILTGAVALRATPEDLGKTVGAVLKAYKMPSTETQKIVDLMTKSADISAMDWADLQTMIPRAVQSASLADMPFEDVLALFAAARNAQVHVASGSVAIKNMLISGAIHGKEFNEMLDKIIASPNAIKKAYKMFGQRTLVTALPLAEARKMGDIEAFKKQLMGSFEGYAQAVATVRLDSIRGRITLLKRSWEELVLAIDDGRGPVGAALKQYLDIASAMLLISADSDIAREKLATMNSTVLDTARSYLGWLKIIGYVTVAIIAMRVALIAWNAAIVIGKVLMFAWSVALGVAAAAGWANVAALRGNVVAIAVLRGAVGLATAAQWLWNAAMAANPIGLIIIGISLLAAWIGVLIAKWDEWGAAASLSLGFLLSFVMSIVNNVNVIKDAFTNGGVIKGIKAIGNVLGEAILYPMQQIAEIMGMLGWTKMSVAAKQMERERAARLSNNGAQTTWEPSVSGREMITPTKTVDPFSGDYNDYLRQIGVTVDINNNTPFPAKAKSDGAQINLVPQSTFEF